MPLVRIDTRRGLTGDEKLALFDAVHGAFVAAFAIPDHDRAQRLHEHAAEDFEIPPGKGPRFTIIEITAFPGRSLAAKRVLYRELATRLERLGIPPRDLVVVLHEPPLESWCVRDGVPASETDLGFKLDV